MKRIDLALVAFGVLGLIVGVGGGYYMCTHPEGLDPDWPLWMALLAPAVFALGGLHVIGAGLGMPRLANAMLQAIVLCFGAIANWAAFFTTHIQCVATVSFLGIPIGGWQPSEIECRNSLRAVVAIVDAAVVIVIGLFAWHRYRAQAPDQRPRAGA